jgi:protein O-mannosyl-transferase
MTDSPKRRWIAAACVALFIATLGVYWQTRTFEFTDYDDQAYVWQNPKVIPGLTPSGMWWGLTTTYFSYWHPVTWWSHQLDCSLFGLNAGGHHMTSAVLHAVNTVLCLLVLGYMTGRWGCSAFVAALFGLHPLHVESVAWIAERKDVLSGLFFFLTIGAYAWHARRGGKWRYLLALAMFAGGVASKPMLVTLPCVLLLLDLWPLHRLRLFDKAGGATSQTATVRMPVLLLEKIPFFALSFFSAAITYIGVKKAGTMAGSETISWGLRLANTPVSYARYLVKTFWPGDMVFLYPMPLHWETWQVIASCAAVLAITVLAVVMVRRAPWLLVGWLIFLGMLVPTLNIIAVGLQSIADRYTYIPLLGVFVMLTWGAAELLRRLPARVWIGGAAALLICAAMMAGTFRQVGVWRNSLTLFGHAVKVDPNNAVAHYNLGLAQALRGGVAEPIQHFERAIALHHSHKQFPDVYKAYNNLGFILGQQGRWAEATNYLAEAHRRRPDDPDVSFAYGSTLAQGGALTQAITLLERVIEQRPAAAEPAVQLARALDRAGRVPEAERQLRRAMRDGPPSVEVMDRLAWLLATSSDSRVRNGTEAIELSTRANQLVRTNNPALMLTTAAALAEAGQFDTALEKARAASAEATRLTQTHAAMTAEKLLADFAAKRAHRDAAK